MEGQDLIKTRLGFSVGEGVAAGSSLEGILLGRGGSVSGFSLMEQTVGWFHP